MRLGRSAFSQIAGSGSCSARGQLRSASAVSSAAAGVARAEAAGI